MAEKKYYRDKVTQADIDAHLDDEGDIIPEGKAMRPLVESKYRRRFQSEKKPNNAIHLPDADFLFDSQDEKKAFNSQILVELLESQRLEPVKNDEEAIEAANRYFQRMAESGNKPTWEELCLSLGTNRSRLNEVINGQKKNWLSRDLVIHLKEILAAFDAKAVTAGKLDAVTYIYRSKNYYDMVDKKDVVVSNNDPLGESESVESLAEKYRDRIVSPDMEQIEAPKGKK